MKFKLAPYVRIGFQKEELHFGFGSIQKIVKEKELQEALISSAKFLNSYESLQSLESHLKNEGFQDEIIKKNVHIMEKNRLLISENIWQKNDRHSRTKLFLNMYTDQVDKTLKAIQFRHIGIVGCGGIGNIVSVNLATIGVTKFTLVDDDSIEESNLSRQFLFKESDCQKSKAKTLANALKERSHNVDIDIVDCAITEKNVNLLSNCDFIVLSGDSKNLPFIINKFAVERKIPFINVGYIQDIAVWGPLVVPGETGCLECGKGNFTEQSDLRITKINGNYQAPSIGPVNMIAASHASLDIIKFIGGFGEVKSLNKRVGIWTHNLTIQEQIFSKNSECRVCH